MANLTATERLQKLCVEICPLKVGDQVEVAPGYEHAGDWRGQYIVTGIRWDYQRRGSSLNIAIASEDEICAGDGDADGFSPSDLVFVGRRT